MFPAGGFRRINLSAFSPPQKLPLFDSRGAIHAQKADRDPAPGTQPENFAIAILIVVVPAIKAWMKQRRELSSIGIYRGDVTAFEPIADSATQGEIVYNCLTAMLHCDHMINLVSAHVNRSEIRQYSHRPAARNRTCFRSAASMSGIARERREL
jgi:hypothetical protein